MCGWVCGWVGGWVGVWVGVWVGRWVGRWVGGWVCVCWFESQLCEKQLYPVTKRQCSTALIFHFALSAYIICYINEYQYSAQD